MTVVGESADGTTVSLAIGAELEIALPQGALPVVWELDEDRSDGLASVVAVAPARRRAADSTAAGAAGEIRFPVRAVAEGRGRVALRAVEPWNREEEPAARYALEVTVTP